MNLHGIEFLMPAFYEKVNFIIITVKLLKLIQICQFFQNLKTIKAPLSKIKICISMIFIQEELKVNIF